MATIAANSYPLEFNFIDNPIIVGVTNFNFPADSTFRQAVVVVSVFPMTGDLEDSVYSFYADASSGTTVWLDISTALRSAMGAWSPNINEVVSSSDSTFTYPLATFNVTVYEKYLLDGNVYEEQGAIQEGAYAYFGGLSEYERLVNDKHPADIFLSDGTMKYLTRKPGESGRGEIIETGFNRTYSYFKDGRVYTRSYLVTMENEGRQGYDGAGFFWQLPPSGERVQFAFINSLGVIETIMGQNRESLNYEIKSEVKSLVTSPRFKTNPNLTTHKTGGRNKWKMSSGMVSREWADWWVSEFLMAKKYWMLLNGVWLPVVVTPTDDSIEVYNKAEQILPHVDFDVQLAVNGSIINTL